MEAVSTMKGGRRVSGKLKVGRRNGIPVGVTVCVVKGGLGTDEQAVCSYWLNLSCDEANMWLITDR